MMTTAFAPSARTSPGAWTKARPSPRLSHLPGAAARPIPRHREGRADAGAAGLQWRSVRPEKGRRSWSAPSCPMGALLRYSTACPGWTVRRGGAGSTTATSPSSSSARFTRACWNTRWWSRTMAAWAWQVIMPAAGLAAHSIPRKCWCSSSWSARSVPSWPSGGQRSRRRAERSIATPAQRASARRPARTRPGLAVARPQDLRPGDGLRALPGQPGGLPRRPRAACHGCCSAPGAVRGRKLALSLAAGRAD